MTAANPSGRIPQGVPVVEKKNKAVGLEDFYKFQKREKRDQKMEELRRKFEEDKIKVERAKQGRKFKPF